MKIRHKSVIENGDYGYPTVYDASNIETGNQSAYGNPYLFNGRHWAADTGLYWYRTRYMDPELGRFISRDTIGLWGDENNLGNPYTYAGNNPWSRLEPYGEAGAILGSTLITKTSVNMGRSVRPRPRGVMAFQRAWGTRLSLSMTI